MRGSPRMNQERTRQMTQLPLGHPARSPDWSRVQALMQDGDLMATLLDAFALYHPEVLEAAKARVQLLRP